MACVPPRPLIFFGRHSELAAARAPGAASRDPVERRRRSITASRHPPCPCQVVGTLPYGVAPKNRFTHGVTLWQVMSDTLRRDICVSADPYEVGGVLGSPTRTG